MEKESLLKKQDYKILFTVEYLNKKMIYPNSFGIYKILKGIKDEETINYIECLTFSSSISINSKRIANRITHLIRLNYLQYKYNPKDDKLYVQLNTKGFLAIDEYLKKHSTSFKKTFKKESINFVKID